MDKDKLHVTYFQRKPRPGFNFSMEAIFEDVRYRISNHITPKVYICSDFNDGWKSKISNILEAYRRQGNGVNHITGEVHFLNLLMKKNRVVLTILDCGMMNRKSGFSRKIIQWLYLKAPVAKAQLVTAISAQTKEQIVDFTGCNPNKIVVIPVAIATRFKPSPKDFNEDCPKILQIGTGANKNLERLIEALGGISCELQIVGKLSPKQLSLLEQYSINYTSLSNLSNDEILKCYQDADIVSFVSTAEGFGMPILEAHAVERVVVTSNVSSMPEVAGEAACLVNPFEVESIKQGFLKVIADKEYRDQLIANGRVNKLRYDPQYIAERYLEVYKSVVNKKQLD
ncbi:glycosyltransferase family 4 protein [Leeuwenhoekiella sp. MAR_2009_132]|uniref:glycosyltransferase family 4 protein n=1 Tax=Leeuwenhoekiella sp. MAR_2009_132 TaxID=1392489 RepID=UPI00048AA4B9|nr:glycosyltransferase family 1 protein [Leeuwenhoekiella sp. MAR_2009_132]